MSKPLRLLLFVFCFATCIARGQNNRVSIKARLDTLIHTLQLQQETVFVNTSKDTLHEILLNDWANSFSTKQSALAKRFAENYDRSFHLARKSYRGATTIGSVTGVDFQSLGYSRPEDAVDVLIIKLKQALPPGGETTFRINYTVKLPYARFTRFGFMDDGDYNLRYWFLSPAVYDDQWESFSNKNLDDLYMAPTDFKIELELPNGLKLVSDFDQEAATTAVGTTYKAVLKGDSRTKATIYLRHDSSFEIVDTEKIRVLTSISESKTEPTQRTIIVDRVTRFITNELGVYPFKKLVLSEENYRDTPVYGLNQLPDFISPFPNEFEYELKILKTAINQFVDNTLLVNQRTDRWVDDGIKIYLMMRYIDENYPDLKVIGTLERFWLIRQYNIANLEFNDQYNLLYLHMARLNLDQALSTPHDSLIKFNKNIANPYKAGSGLKYLESYLDKPTMDTVLKDFYAKEKLKLTTSIAFESLLRESTDKDLDWFFDDYVNTRSKIDYKFKNVKKLGDSLRITLKNLRQNKMPIPLVAMKGDSILFKKWITGFKKEKTITIKDEGADQLVLNGDGGPPEFNRRNNYKKINPFLGFNKPVQFKLFQDLEDPSKNQVFFMPIFEYNFYDGVSLGARMYNKTLLSKPFNYSFEPQFGLKSKSLVGGLGFSYTQNIEEGNLYAVRAGFSGSIASFAPDAFYKKYTPFLTFAFRTEDYRSDKRQFLTIKNINVDRDDSQFITNDDPNYNVFNVTYTNSSPGVINSFRWDTDFQLSKKFSKISATAKYRRVFLNNRQFDFRLFAGSFLYNDTRSDGDFFSFALDRPTDYLFNYNYYGRSEDTGVFSQQLIVAEGGFKSQLDTPFGNEWMTTMNASTTLWRFLHVYGDVGLIKNKGDNPRFAYDSGIRAVFVEDYFELYFPVYSSNGWEVAQPDYDQKIRFIVTLSLNTLLNLFTRKWY